MSVTVWDGAQPPSDPADRLQVASTRSIPWHLAEAESAAESDSAAFAFRFHLGLARVAGLSDSVSYARRASLLARLDDWPAAIEDWRRWAESGEPDDGASTLGLARGLLRTGDRAGYLALCARLVADGGTANRPVITWQVARALALSADSGITPAQLLGLARAIPPSRKQAGRIGMTVALAAFRAGRPDEAFDLAIKATMAEPSRAFACWPLASLVLKDLGRLPESRDYFRKAEAHAVRGKDEGPPFPEDWPEFLLLLEEARNSISDTGR
jgi:tetratricopeptide (TPR) repeat protein